MIGEQSKVLYLRGFGFLHWMAGLDQGNTDYYYFVRSAFKRDIKMYMHALNTYNWALSQGSAAAE